MKQPCLQQTPVARKEDLIIKRLDDELLIYDLNRHTALCLNAVVQSIWDMCDGKTSVSQMAISLSGRMEEPINEDVIMVGLAELDRFHLLAAGTSFERSKTKMSRREMVRRLAIAGVLSLPLITSIVAPTATAAASCSSLGQPCGGSNPPCCPTLGLGCVLGICIQL